MIFVHTVTLFVIKTEEWTNAYLHLQRMHLNC